MLGYTETATVEIFCCVSEMIYLLLSVLSGPADLETIFVSNFVSGKKKICLGVFYRPPDHPHLIVSWITDFMFFVHLMFRFCLT